MHKLYTVLVSSASYERERLEGSRTSGQNQGEEKYRGTAVPTTPTTVGTLHWPLPGGTQPCSSDHSGPLWVRNGRNFVGTGHALL